MDEQRAWLKAGRKRRLRILAVMLSFCVLLTNYPNIVETLSVFAAAESEQPETRLISGFTALSDEIREQTVPVGTELSELTLPDTLEAVVTMTGENQPSEDTEEQPGDDGKEDGEEADDGESDGKEPDGDTTGTEDQDSGTGEPEDGGSFGPGQNDTETGGETGDNGTEVGDGQDAQPEGGESEETDGTIATENGDEGGVEKEENTGESAPAEEQGESVDGQESAPSEEPQESAHAQETYTVTMQEYLAENVLPVQTLVNAQAEAQEGAEKKAQEETEPEEWQEPQKKAQEETIKIDGVTWRSEPAYDGNTEGMYIFTAVLPEGYVLAEDVSLPQICVTVEQAGARRAARAAAASDGGGTGVAAVSAQNMTINGYGNNLTVTQGSTADTTKLYYTGDTGPIGPIDLSPAEGSVEEGFHLEQYALNTTGGTYAYNSLDIMIHMNGGVLDYFYTNVQSDKTTHPNSVQVFMSGGTLLCDRKDEAISAHVVDISGSSVIKGKLQGNEALSVSGSPQIGGEGKGITISSGNSFTVKGALSDADIYVNPQENFADGTIIAQAASGYTITAGDLAQLKLTGNYVEGKELYLENNAVCIRVKPAAPHTVTYDYGTNDGTSATKASDTVLEGAEIDLAPTAAKDGWEFVGWNTDQNAHEGLTSLTMDEADVTLYAIYKKTLSASFYSGSAGVKETVSTTIYNRATAGSVEAPSMKPWAEAAESGYTAWHYSDGEFSGESIDPGDTVSMSLTAGEVSYYGLYKKNITVSYNANGGSGSADAETVERQASVHEQVKYRTTSDVTLHDGTGFSRDGYDFNGWIADSPGGTTIVKGGTSVRPTGDTVYYASWKPGAYTVTYNKNSGAIANENAYTKYTYGTELTLPTPTRTGYRFDGWYTDSGFAGTAVTKITATDIGNKTFYAKWTDDIAPVIGTLEYSYEPASLWHWLIGKDSLTITVPVTEEGSGADVVTYTVTPEGAAAEEKTVALRDGVAEITVSADFKGTISITCTDKADNVSAGVTVGTGLDAAGVIIEDNAPDITVLADRTPSDNEQTQPNGVAVEDRYYETVPALLVTVKDDMDNAITGGLASITYQVGSGAAKTVTFDKSTLQKSAQAAFSISASEISTGITEITVNATDNAGNTAAKKWTIKVKGPENKPAAEIDYRKEKLTNLAAGGTYRINDKEYTADGEGCIPIETDWFDNSLSMIKAGNGSETTDSPVQSLPVPARPAKPAPTGKDVAVPGGSGELTGLTADTVYGVSTDGGKTWTGRRSDGNGAITGLAPGVYTLRVEAGDASFASENSSPAKIGAYQIKVTFMVNGETCRELFVDYGGTLADIPPIPPVEDAVGVWCSDGQGTPATFANITADMTVYAVYTKYYTVTLQDGTGYTLSAETGSENPVKEGGCFVFRFALEKGYQKTKNFAVKINGVTVELTAEEPYTYTISNIRAHRTVTVEGVAKKSGGKPSGSGEDKDKGDGNDRNPDAPALSPNDQSPDNPSAAPSVNQPVNPAPPVPAADAAAGTISSEDGMQPEGRRAQTNLEREQSGGQRKNGKAGEGQEMDGAGAGMPGKEAADAGMSGTSGADGQNAGTPGTDGTPTGASGADSAGSGLTAQGTAVQKEEVKLGDGTVIVTVVCEEEKCSAAVADAGAVAKAVLTPDQRTLVNGGATIEVRIDVTDISEQVPPQDKEMIESGIETYREEMPGLVLGMYVDISMFIKVGAGDWNAVTETDEPIEVVVNIPEKLLRDGREYSIIRAHNGEYTFMNDMDDAPDTITVSTALFSSYAVAYVETDGAEAGAKCGLCHICPTFLGICCFIWLAFILAVTVIVIFVILRRRKED